VLRRKSQACHSGGNSSSATPLGIWAVIVSRGRSYAVERARNTHLTPNGLYRIRANAALGRMMRDDAGQTTSAWNRWGLH
jgi:hypothetical protein